MPLPRLTAVLDADTEAIAAEQRISAWTATSPLAWVRTVTLPSEFTTRTLRPIGRATVR